MPPPRVPAHASIRGPLLSALMTQLTLGPHDAQEGVLYGSLITTRVASDASEMDEETRLVIASVGPPPTPTQPDAPESSDERTPSNSRRRRAPPIGWYSLRRDSPHVLSVMESARLTSGFSGDSACPLRFALLVTQHANEEDGLHHTDITLFDAALFMNVGSSSSSSSSSSAVKGTLPIRIENLGSGSAVADHLRGSLLDCEWAADEHNDIASAFCEGGGGGPRRAHDRDSTRLTVDAPSPASSSPSSAGGMLPTAVEEAQSTLRDASDEAERLYEALRATLVALDDELAAVRALEIAGGDAPPPPSSAGSRESAATSSSHQRSAAVATATTAGHATLKSTDDILKDIFDA
jgi:hypothetical protein